MIDHQAFNYNKYMLIINFINQKQKKKLIRTNYSDKGCIE